MDPDVVITFDIDCAPDFVIDRVADALRERRVPATWFVRPRWRSSRRRS